MSLFATAIGALVALLPRPTLDKADARFIAGYDAGLKDGRREGKEAEVEVERLTRSHARLVNHIETVEREFLIEQHLSTHWKAEAERLARQSREAREAREEQARLALQAHFQALAQEQQALLQQYQGLQPALPADGRQALACAQQNAALAQQHQLANYANQAQGLQWRGDYDGFCNCVPSRAQVWGANRGEG